MNSRDISSTDALLISAARSAEYQLASQEWIASSDLQRENIPPPKAPPEDAAWRGPNPVGSLAILPSGRGEPARVMVALPLDPTQPDEPRTFVANVVATPHGTRVMQFWPYLESLQPPTDVVGPHEVVL